MSDLPHNTTCKGDKIPIFSMNPIWRLPEVHVFQPETFRSGWRQHPRIRWESFIQALLDYTWIELIKVKSCKSLRKIMLQCNRKKRKAIQSLGADLHRYKPGTWRPCQDHGQWNKLAKLRGHASRVHFAKIHFGKIHLKINTHLEIHFWKYKL